jgi:MFS family permease
MDTAPTPAAVTGRASAWRRHLGVPELAGQGRIVAGTTLDAFGVGLFVPLSFLFFALTTRLTVAEIGLGTSIATVLSLPLAPLAGSAVDRWGPRRALVANNLLSAAGYLCYLLVDSLPALVGSMFLVLCADRLYWAAWPAFVADIAEGSELDRWYAFTAVGKNASVGVGGAAGGLLLGSGWSGAAVLIVLLNALTSVVTAALFLKPSSERTSERLEKPVVVAADQPSAEPVGWGSLLRDRGLLTLIGAQAALSFAWLIPTIILPVYLVEVDKLPTWLPSTALALNALVIVLAQSPLTGRLLGFPRTRVISWASLLMLGTITLLAFGPRGRGVVTVAVVFAAALLFTVGEMMAGPATSAIAATAAAPEARGRYLSLFNLTWSLSATVGPTLVGTLVQHHTAVLWGVLALLVALGGVGFRLADRLAGGQDRPARPGRVPGAEAGAEAEAEAGAGAGAGAV